MTYFCWDPFQGFFGLYQGASNHEELHALMKATVMIRRLKKDVLSKLPVKHRQQVTTAEVLLTLTEEIWMDAILLTSNKT
jgi:SNF2 family DNA or RNA helicase